MGDYTRNTATGLDDSQIDFGFDTITETVGGQERKRKIHGRDSSGRLVVSSEVASEIASIQDQIVSMETQTRKIEVNGLSPAGPGNKSRFVYQIVDGWIYHAWANPSATGDDLEVLLSDVTNAPNVWKLIATGLDRPYSANMSHLYDTYTRVYVESSRGRTYFALLRDASLAQRQTNPTDPVGDTSKWQKVDETVESSTTTPPASVTYTGSLAITGAGYEGREISIASEPTWDTTYPVTTTLHVNGSNTGISTFPYTVTRNQHGASFQIWQESAGVIVKSNIITNFLPTSANPTMGYDHRDPRIEFSSGNNIRKLVDLTSNQFDMVLKDAVAAPTLESGRINSVANTDYVKITTRPSVGEVYVVAQYQDGVVSSFRDYSQIILGGKRIMGQVGAATLFSGSNFATDDVYKNGNSASTKTVLPLPKTLLRLTYNSPAYAEAIMCGGQAGRGWFGPWWRYFAYPESQNEATRQKIEGAMAWMEGIEDALVDGHPWKSSPPPA